MVARRRARPGPGLPRIAVLRVLTLPLVVVAGLAAAMIAPAQAESADRVYLVTLDGPGLAGYAGPATAEVQLDAMLAVQRDVLEGRDSGSVLYRWTSALNGFAVEMSAEAAERLSRDPRVALVEENDVRRLAGGLSAAALPATSQRGRGGAGLVVGVIDTGIWPDSSLFASVPGLGKEPRDFAGGCDAGAEWGADTCNEKLVGAQWFVSGFGADNLRTSSSLSPRDDSGHGTQMASIAAGNSGVSVDVPGLPQRTYSGHAPQARIAVYKACWSAPDPDDDGCATADLVTAIDRATRDGVDVINLSVGGPPGLDTVERALLGAAERDIVVIAAAGNDNGGCLRRPRLPVGDHRGRGDRGPARGQGAGRRRADAGRRDGLDTTSEPHPAGAGRRGSRDRRLPRLSAGLRARLPGRLPGRGCRRRL